LVAGVGADEPGQQVIDTLVSEGVDVSGVVSVTNAETARSLVTVARDTDSRAIITKPFAAMGELVNSHSKALLEAANWAHFDHAGWQICEELGLRRGQGTNISLDLGYLERDLRVSQVDLYAPTASVVEQQRPGVGVVNAVKEFAKDSSNVVVATLGSRGVVGSDGDEVVDVPAFAVKTMSTLGAGDVFHGALVAQFHQQRPLTDALRRASAVAAISCRALDGRTGVPSEAELEDFLAEQTAQSEKA
jgi:sulfofructose kinase